MGKIKGTCVASVFSFLEERLGAQALDEALARRSAEDRELLSRPALAFKWYPLDAYVRLLATFERGAIAEDRGAGRRMGAKIVRDGLTGIYRVMLGVLSQDYILGRAPQLWTRYFEGEDLELNDVRPASLEATVRGQISPCPLYCQTILGGIEETVRLAGGKDVVGEEISCRSAGRDRCSFTVRWR